MRTRQSRLAVNQTGFASIVIAIVLVLVLSLMTTGFAELMRHEQTRALDRQLSSQAYYAAETGVNDAVKALNADPTTKKTTCTGVAGISTTNPTAQAALANNNVGNNTGSSYTCLLIDPTPPTLEFAPIDTVHSHTVEVNGVDATTGAPAAIGSITLSWHASDGSTTILPGSNVCSDLQAAAGWQGTGILRTQIVPIHVDGSGNSDVDRASLISNSYTAYLCPTVAAGIGDYNRHGVTTSGDVVGGSCNASNGVCTATINNISAPPNKPTYTLLLNLKSIYQANNVTVSITDALGGPLLIAKAQAVVDSTGQAQDVLRRIQVRVPLASVYNYETPDGTQAASSICKQLDLVPNSSTVNGPSSGDCTLR